ncbi:Lrp/AsnC family transcriptional regulator [Moraxella nasicaprae]|uniref:Lrp/AsnC family transcriptional regulator n=1 Tax=Moraxella nasicaprae TaxID=2904122 RepID=A0ABY6F3H9_9GAMM|nr:Lrp/AsnC family transcriptional regulator [Moraxella nasicaprae]UXZ04656.1 Lrp/AsnC family transcriptional regulator [Moraxella nasicaprae]
MSGILELDQIDKRILNILQKDSSLSNTQLAELVGLSPSPCLRRVKILEEQGFISGYTAKLNAEKLDCGLTLFVRVWLKTQTEDAVNHFADSIRFVDEVQECYLMVGDCDFVLKVVVKDLESYRQFQVRHLTHIKNVLNIKTEVPVQTIKRSHLLPI